MLYREQTFAPRAFHSELQQQTNTVNTQKSPPWACDKGCAEACAERFSALNFKDSPFPIPIPRFPIPPLLSKGHYLFGDATFWDLHVNVSRYFWRVATFRGLLSFVTFGTFRYILFFFWENSLNSAIIQQCSPKHILKFQHGFSSQIYLVNASNKSKMCIWKDKQVANENWYILTMSVKPLIVHYIYH